MNEKLEKLNRQLAQGEARLRRAQHEEKILEHQMKQLRIRHDPNKRTVIITNVPFAPAYGRGYKLVKFSFPTDKKFYKFILLQQLRNELFQL